MSEFVYFSCPRVRIWGFPTFSKTLQKIEKIEVYTHRGPGELFWFNSLMCPFSIQMSEFIYFSCPVVRIWGFSSFSKTFQKIEKIEVFAHRGPGELFGLNSLKCPFSIQMSEIIYFSCPGVRIWGFSSFSKIFQKIEKIEVFSPNTDLGNFLGSIYSCAHFPSKWVNLYILVVLEWEYEYFLHFRKSFQKIYKIEVFAHSGPGELFYLNSLMCPFSIQMSEFIYFSCPVVRIWGFSSFSKTFQKIEKIEVFAHRGPGELFGLNSLKCPFSIQMSEIIYFSCPGVRIWGFSSFSKIFQKIEKIEVFSPNTDLGNFLGSIYSCAHFPSKWVNLYILVVLEWEYEYFLHFRKSFQKIYKIEVFAHSGPGELFYLNSLMCPFSIQMSEFVYFSCPGVRIWGFYSFSKTFQKIEKFEVFGHLRSVELVWLNSLMCPFSIQMSEFVYFCCPGVRIWGFSSFSKTFQKIK